MLRYYLLLITMIALAVSCQTYSSGGSSTDDTSTEETGDPDYVSPYNEDVDVTTDAASQLAGSDGWYKDAIFYHIWVKSFADSNSDGCGDLAGITSKLDNLQSLGINAIWLSPIFECDYKTKSTTGNMHGYDTRDYYSINSYFGTESDLETLLQQAHSRGIRVIFDFVPNHTGTGNQWFIDSKAGTSAKKNWYIWQSTQPTGWVGTDGSTNPWYSGGSRGYYYGIFWSGMPDLNYRNVEVRAEIKNVARYWLNRGFDGIRVDAVRYLYENGSSAVTDQTETHEFFNALRTDVIDKYGDLGYAKMMVSECWASSSIIKNYYGSTDDSEFQMSFDFPFAYAVVSSINNSNKSSIASLYETEYGSSKTYPDWARPATFINNHDEVNDRPVTEFNDNYNKALLADAINILSPGTPFIYYGNEIGMTSDSTSGDIRLRLAYDWDEYTAESKNSTSMLSYYTYLIEARNSYASLRTGSYQAVTTDNSSIMAFTKKDEDTGDETLVIFNLSSSTKDTTLNLTDSGVTQSSMSVAIGTEGKAPTTINSSNYSAVSIEDIAPYGFRVYVVGTDSAPHICDDVVTL